MIVEAYDLSPKFKWNAAKNKNKLRPIKEAFDEQRDTASARLRSMKVAFVAPESKDETAVQAAFQAHLAKIEAAEFEENAKLAALGEQPNEIDGLLKLPADGIKIRARDPGLIGLLDLLMADFLDGEPDFGDTKPKAD